MRIQRFVADQLPYIIIIALQVFLWFNYISNSHRGDFPVFAIAICSACVVLYFLVVRKVLFYEFKPLITASFVVNLISVFLLIFSEIYWSYGTAKNFGINLSHLDAFYFALGTFTTAGTGNISATSEQARGIQTLQMGLGFLIIGIVFTLGVTRYYDYLKSPKNVKPHVESTSDTPDGGTGNGHESGAAQVKDSTGSPSTGQEDAPATAETDTSSPDGPGRNDGEPEP